MPKQVSRHVWSMEQLTNEWNSISVWRQAQCWLFNGSTIQLLHSIGDIVGARKYAHGISGMGQLSGGSSAVESLSPGAGWRPRLSEASMLPAGSVQKFWDTGIRQLRAVAKREFRRSETKIQGARLLLSLRHLDRTPREPSPQVTSPVQPPDSQEEPALLTRFRIYQKSCTH
uniref:RxLR effector candidate protein n=1 Tax=Hyaloperonospora arabidopsidis (strain Emoy2) TaxID=559515 RepID=M4B2J9_HYAAE